MDERIMRNDQSPHSDALSLKRKSPGTMTPTASSNALVRIFETSVLRSLAFVLYHLDRPQARSCVRAILEWYGHLQTRLPLFVVDSLEQCATSFVALSDAEFTAFWVSLVEEPRKQENDSVKYIPVTIEDQDEPIDVEPDATLVERLYRQICGRVQRLFGLPACIKPPDEFLYVQTPLTSRDDKYDEEHLYGRRASPSLVGISSGSFDEANEETYYGPDNRREPGWAVEYIEEESRVSSEITQRMRRMMHSSIPLNLFRVAVVYPASGDSSSDDNGLQTAGFVGIVSPESFPPTPITRDLQTRRIHHYTATVLDHATLALRLLDTNYAS